jgi:hypothetical protein
MRRKLCATAERGKAGHLFFLLVLMILILIY